MGLERFACFHGGIRRISRGALPSATVRLSGYWRSNVAKLSKAAVAFEHPAKGKDRCASCKHFLRGNRCAIVAGVVMPQDWCKRYEEKDMAKLSYGQRQAMPSGQFIFPKTKGYPIPDVKHGRAALQAAGGARSGKPASPAKRATIRAAVHAKFPQIKLSSMARAS